VPERTGSLVKAFLRARAAELILIRQDSTARPDAMGANAGWFDRVLRSSRRSDWHGPPSAAGASADIVGFLKKSAAPTAAG
jgi:hypothetical protein